MPNRILKESICTSDNLDQLAPQEEVLFYRLITACDDYGCTDARPQIVKARCFPLRETITTEDVDSWLMALQDVGLIRLYVAEGRRYLHMVKWERHQQVRAKRHKYPEPPSESDEAASNYKQAIADASNSPRNPIQSESLSESESDTPSVRAKHAKAPQANGKADLTHENEAMYAALCDAFGKPETDSERGKYNKAGKELRNADPPVLPENIPKVKAAYNKRWPDMECTPMAIAANLGLLRNSQAPSRAGPDARSLEIAISQARRDKRKLYCDQCGTQEPYFHSCPEGSYRYVPFEYVKKKTAEGE